MRVLEQMDLLTEHATKALLAERQPPCVSIFLPTARRGAETLQGPIRLKNLIRRAAGKLNSTGIDEFRKNDLLAPARSLLKNEDFWQSQSDGLAIFLARDGWWIYRLPLEFDEVSLVNEHFHLRPLIPLLSFDGHFFILALGQGNMRLFEATRHQIGKVALDEVPDHLQELLRLEGAEASMQKHAQRDLAITDYHDSARSHAAGAASNQKDRILDYFRQVDGNVREILGNERVPLVLAGPDHLQGLYRQANKYAHLLDDGVDGNPDDLSPEELLHRTWEQVAPMVKKELVDALGRYQHFRGNEDEHATNDIEVLAPAAKNGRVDTLFIRKGAQIFGRVDPETHGVSLHGAPQDGGEELVNYSVLETLRHRGKVYRLTDNELPEETPCAAILRY